jgi:hypothetical protein
METYKMSKADQPGTGQAHRVENHRWLEALSGKTLRFTFEQGPTSGSSYDHTFREDGTVSWRDPAKSQDASASPEDANKEPPTKYGSFQVADDVYVVSYLSKSGYTLTVALNFETDELFGFASNDQNWYPVSGVFEVLS